MHCRSDNSMSVHAVFAITLAVVLVYTSAILPDYIHVCRGSDPNIAACINNSVNQIRPRLKSGIPDLDVPPLEPLPMGEINLKRGPSAAAIDCNITNLNVWGAASFVVTELIPNIRKNRFNFKVWLPHLHFKGDYELDMKILLINVHGKGPIHGNFTDYRSDVVMKGRKIMINNKEYLKFDKLRLRLTIGKTELFLGNLFDNDPVLRQISGDAINDNTDLFINEIKPVLENSLADKFREIANKITLKFTYDELFP